MNIVKSLPVALAAGAIMVASAASASTVTYTPNQGLDNSGNAVAANRSLLSNLDDGNVNTFFSLGNGGSLTASLAPFELKSASLVEVTFGNTSSHPESALVYLGTDSSGTLLGEIFNLGSGGTTTSANGATILAAFNTPSTGITTFTIDLGANVGTALTFVDTSFTNFAQTEANADGFDIGELSISAVPLPAGAWLMLAGLGGLAAVRRAKKAS